MVWFAEVLVTFIPVALNYYELSVDAFAFSYDQSWYSAALGGTYAILWTLVRLWVEIWQLEDAATIQTYRSTAPFIYETMPFLGENWFVYILSNALIFGGLQYAIQLEITSVTAMKSVLGASNI